MIYTQALADGLAEGDRGEAEIFGDLPLDLSECSQLAGRVIDARFRCADVRWIVIRPLSDVRIKQSGRRAMQEQFATSSMPVRQSPRNYVSIKNFFPGVTRALELYKRNARQKHLVADVSRSLRGRTHRESGRARRGKSFAPSLAIRVLASLYSWETPNLRRRRSNSP